MDSKNEKDTKSLEEEEERNVNCFISIYKNITIEPAMFVLGLAGGVVGPFFAQFEITKICKFDFGYNETVCNDENLVKYFKEENDEIQREVIPHFTIFKLVESSTLSNMDRQLLSQMFVR